MKRGALLLAALAIFAAQAFPADAGYRVELFSRQKVETATFRAGGAPLHLSADRSRGASLEVSAGGEAQCAPSRNVTILCRSGKRAVRVRRLVAVSSAPFRLQVGFRSSAVSERNRAVSLRSAEIHFNRTGLRVIGTFGREAYVAGVLAGEAATLQSPAALQAMAVVARTWALGASGRHRGFDFCSLTHCQVFRAPPETGDASEFTEAARKTSGKGLKFRGRLVDPYYSASCGGVTEAARDVWPDRAQPYLASVNDPYCGRAEPSSWEQSLPLSRLRAVLRGVIGPAAERVRDVRIESKTSSGRARSIRWLGGSGTPVDATAFRYTVNRRLGWNTLKSNLYTLRREGDALIFSGRGLGHGVGLCQRGAEQMGQMGLGYEAILAHYFPGAAVAGIESPGAKQMLSSEYFEFVFPAGQEPWVSESLDQLESFRRGLGRRAATLPDKIRVETWETTEEFIRATGQPGWAAGSTDGRTIALQPLGTLRGKGLLHTTLRHELAHFLVHPLRAREVPQWFEEGMVLLLTGERIESPDRRPSVRRTLEASLSRPRSEDEMKAAYAEALRRVRRLARRGGEAALWRALERPSADDIRGFKE